MASRMRFGGLSLESGLALHRAGKLREAAAIYGQVLQANPKHPDGLHLLGLVLHQLGDHLKADAFMSQAIRLNPSAPAYRNNHGMVFRALGMDAKAVVSFRAALQLDPVNADALANLGGSLPWSSREREARRSLRRACLLVPSHDEGLASLGAMERATGHLDRAMAAHRRALTVQPLMAARRLNVGSCLVESDRYGEAKGYLVQATLLDPALPEAWSDLGFLLMGRMQVVQAERCFRHALEIRPRHGPAWAGRAETAYVAGDALAAVQASQRAVELDPANPHLRLRLGMHRLATGDLERGWVDHDAMWRKPDAVKRIGAPPRWDGGSLEGKTLLVTADQGVGDELLFASCIPDAIRAAGRVVLECDPRLVDLFRRSFPEVFVHAYERGGTRIRPIQRYDWIPRELAPDRMIEAGAMMRWFRPTVASLDAAGTPWLTPDPVRVARMREALDQLGPGLKIGISWRSMRLTETRNAHYPGLAPFEPLLQVPGVRFVCLQYGSDWEPELRATDAPVNVIPDLDTTADLDGVTALVAALDAVVCPSSTLGWVGAAVGTPVWLLYNTPMFLEFGTDRLPGFPSVRPYRKNQPEPWEPMLQRVTTDLAGWAAQSPGAG